VGAVTTAGHNISVRLNEERKVGSCQHWARERRCEARKRDIYALTKKNVLMGPLAMHRCARGSKDAKHKLRKNKMRHFCPPNRIQNEYTSVLHIPKTAQDRKTEEYLISTLIEPRHEWHDRTSEARHHAKRSIQTQFCRLAFESIENDVLHARGDKPVRSTVMFNRILQTTREPTSQCQRNHLGPRSA